MLQSGGRKARLNSLTQAELRACWTVNNQLGRELLSLSVDGGDDGSEASWYEAY